MPLKFCANLSTMYKTMPFYKRLYEAKSMGFSSVEAQFLYDHDLSLLAKAQRETGLEIVMINSPCNTKGTTEEHFGLACIPGYDHLFLHSMEMAIRYAKELKCHKIHVIAGKRLSSYPEEDYRKAYVSSIQSAAKLLEEFNMMLLIEPMSSPQDYYLKNFDQAVSIIEEVNCSNVKLLLDVYHMHKIGMNVEEDIPKYLKFTGHVQVSQSPHRNEPSYPGEIKYKKVFEILEENYCGYIGLEYFPSESASSHDWILN